MIKILLDPKFFNYVILVLFFLNTIRWWIEKKPADAAYWACSLAITAVVTFMFKH